MFGPTKHRKWFSGKRFPRQPNSGKHFPFPEISISEKYVFSEKHFTATKRTLKAKGKKKSQQLWPSIPVDPDKRKKKEKPTRKNKKQNRKPWEKNKSTIVVVWVLCFTCYSSVLNLNNTLQLTQVPHWCDIFYETRFS